MSDFRETCASLWARASVRLRREAILADPLARRLFEACAAVDASAIRARPVAESRFVALDLETTGLHPYLGDEILSLSLIELQGLAFTGRHYTTLIDPGRPIPPEASAIHGIVTADVRHAPAIDAVLPEVIAFLGSGILIAHHANFDLRFLNKQLQRRAAITLKNPWIDTMLLHGAWRGGQKHHSLDEVAEKCGIPVGEDRHNARRDAELAGKIVRFLAPRLLTDTDEAVGRLIDCQFHHHEHTPTALGG
uniref:DNA-directed DNA polymerase n=1 Tax=Candidatus Kentrum sp. DK TaxID=2126562 RepID=A0A450SX22_9GAMM|nr:MAG: DNA polymerase-3 subunit epsilon [Candidatus Kentron sp. DK]VFJ64976.1 MAG: DNA polymerase-3 subunit epsilon [Candidatus Kentron sp. DK]